MLKLGAMILKNFQVFHRRNNDPSQMKLGLKYFECTFLKELLQFLQVLLFVLQLALEFSFIVKQCTTVMPFRLVTP